MTLVLLWVAAALLEWRLWTWGYTPGPGTNLIMTVAWVPLFVAIPIVMCVGTWKWLGGREPRRKTPRPRGRRRSKKTR